MKIGSCFGNLLKSMTVMATLKVVGSGSKANTYLLETKDETLILDLGCKWNDILECLNFKIDKVVGVLVTHSHG